MKKLTLLLAMASVMATAMADEKMVVKDTRTYLTQDGQKALFNGRPVAVGGELLTRSGGWCDRDVYEGPDSLPTLPQNGKMSIVLPKINITRLHYQCDSAGKPV